MRKSVARKCLQFLNEYCGAATDYEEALQHDVPRPVLAKILQTSLGSFSAWQKAEILRVVHRNGNAHMYRLGDVKEQLEKVVRGEKLDVLQRLVVARHPDTQEQAVQECRAVATCVPHIAGVEPFEASRARAMSAAKEAYRDVVLEAADHARKSGDKDLAISLYEDFIHMEQGLRIIYNRE